MGTGKSNTGDGQGKSIRDMIDEAKAINERGRRSTRGAKFMSELLDYITAESKRRGNFPQVVTVDDSVESLDDSDEEEA